MKYLLALFFLIVAGPCLAQAAQDVVAISHAGIFETPTHVKKQIAENDKNFPPDPENPAMRREIDCYYYDRYMVKQIDIGEEGAARLSIAPVKGSKKSTPCTTASASGEYLITPDTWSGYFKGAQGEYFFFDAEDGTQGGMGFAVFDAAKKAKIFDDIAMGDIKGIGLSDGKMKLQYRRAFLSTCSIPAQGEKCWDEIVAKVGLKDAAMPDCATPYMKAKTDMAHMQCEYDDGGDAGKCYDDRMKALDAQKWNEDPTVIGYDVETDLTAATPTPVQMKGEVVCWPAD